MHLSLSRQPHILRVKVIDTAQGRYILIPVEGALTERHREILRDIGMEPELRS